MLYINFLAVFVCAIINMGIGTLWFSPMVFGKQWMQVLGVSPEKITEAKQRGGMWKVYLIAFITSLLTAYVLAQFIFFAGATSIFDGIRFGFWTWLGLIVPVLAGGVLWEGRPRKWLWINALYYLVSILVMSAILAMW